MRIQNKKILASVLFVLMSFVCSAVENYPPQPTEPVMASAMASGTPAPGLPINGFSAGVLVLGLLYGAKRLLYQKP